MSDDGGDSEIEPLIEVRGISKNFGNIEALKDVNMTLREGEILGLLGDNGSGKSTLVKVLVGVHNPTAGEVFIQGGKVEIGGPKEARRYGISTVYQDLALVDDLSVAQNLFLGRMPRKHIGGVVPVVDYDRMEEEAERILRERLNIRLDPASRVEFLSGGERQAVAIARALVTDPKIVIMDEPTSALSADSSAHVRELITTLREEGISVLLISHDLNEIFDLTDRITVLDNGELVGTVDTTTVDKDDVVKMMMSGVMPEEPAIHTS
jgi:ABC-type sugar transport system ATPase subunit